MKSGESDTEEDRKPSALPETQVGNVATMAVTASAGNSAGGGGKSSSDKWETMFQELMKYKRDNGNTLVPNRYPKLGNWVSTQRRYYKARQKGQSTPLSDSRLEKLENAGFVWATTDPRHVPWEVRYEQLVDYKSRFGDCRVPIGFEENVQLANWVSTQRQEWRQERAGRSSRLTSERIQLLNDIGFTWKAPRGGVRRRKIPLTSTVAHAASNKKEHNSGSSSEDESSMTLSKYESPKKKTKTPFVSSISAPFKAKPWIKMFQEFVWQKDQQGDTQGQDPESKDPLMKEWCHKQRAQYRIWRKNPDQSDMTLEQFNLLNSIHFDWKLDNEECDKESDHVNHSKESHPAAAAGIAFVSPPRNLDNLDTIHLPMGTTIVTPAISRNRREDTSTSDAVDALVALRKSMEDMEDSVRKKEP